MKKILLVEDDVLISSLVATELANAGYAVATAFDGKQGLEALKKDVPNLILLDLLMSEMDGYEMLGLMKQDPAMAKIPVIVFSNLGQPEDIKRAKDAGAVDFYIKASTTPQELREKVNALIGLPEA
jgi:CheY-like chemotaxis protein